MPARELKPLPSLPIERHQGSHYIRLMVVDRPGVIADISAALRDAEIPAYIEGGLLTDEFALSQQLMNAQGTTIKVTKVALTLRRTITVTVIKTTYISGMRLNASDSPASLNALLSIDTPLRTTSMSGCCASICSASPRA